MLGRRARWRQVRFHSYSGLPGSLCVAAAPCLCFLPHSLIYKMAAMMLPLTPHLFSGDFKDRRSGGFWFGGRGTMTFAMILHSRKTL